MKHIKWYLKVHVEFVTKMVIGESDTSQPYFKSDVYTLLSKENLSETALNEAFTKQFMSFDEYIARGSGWNLKHIINIEIHTFQYRPIGGSSYIQTRIHSRVVILLPTFVITTKNVLHGLFSHTFIQRQSI